MKLEVGKTYKTRDGGKVTIYKKTDDDMKYPYYGIRHSDNGLYTYLEDGKYTYGSDKWDSDIVAEWSEPEKGTKYLRIYRSTSGNALSVPSFDKPERTDRTIAIVRVDWVEGQFDD